jgi:anti-sigma factor RsiW
MNPLECPREDELVRYLQGALDDQRSARFDLHIPKCESCLACLRAIEKSQPYKSDRFVEACREACELEIIETADTRAITGKVKNVVESMASRKPRKGSS